MLPKHSKSIANRIDFSTISTKVEKVASSKRHMKLLLLEKCI